MIRVTEFLEEIYTDLERSLSPIRWEEQYYISFYDVKTENYDIKTMKYKSQAFKKFLEFIS